MGVAHLEPLPPMVPSFQPKIITISGWPVTGSGRSLDLAGHWIIALYFGKELFEFEGEYEPYR